MPSPFIGGRIPQELHDTLQKHIEDSGEKLPQILQQALSNYLNYTPAVDRKQSGLEERLTALETAFQQLKADLERSETPVAPLVEPDKEVTKLDQLSILEPDNNSDNRPAITKNTSDFTPDITSENANLELDNNTDIGFDNNSDNGADVEENRSNSTPDIISENIDINNDSVSDISGQELKHEQVAGMVGKSLPAVRAAHRRNNPLENNSYRFIPGGIPNHPKWVVEKR